MKVKLLLVSLVLLIFLGGCIEAIPTPFTEKYENEYKTIGVESIAVYNFNGSVSVRPWDRDTVKVICTKKAMFSKADLDRVAIAVEEGKTLTIKAEKLTPNPQVSVTVEISIPFGFAVYTIDTSNGKISLEGASGNTYLKSSNGGVTAKSHTGSLYISTSNGSIEVENISGDVSSITSNGSITAYKIQGKGEFETSNGRMDLKAVNSIASARTSNGSIEIELLSSQSSGCHISTSNASIACSISKKLNLDVECSTSNGKITVSNLQLSSSSISDKYVRGKIGNGGAMLYISTSNGSITLTGTDQ